MRQRLRLLLHLAPQHSLTSDLPIDILAEVRSTRLSLAQLSGALLWQTSKAT